MALVAKKLDMKLVSKTWLLMTNHCFEHGKVDAVAAGHDNQMIERKVNVVFGPFSMRPTS
jgi:hypothetical protein